MHQRSDRYPIERDADHFTHFTHRPRPRLCRRSHHHHHGRRPELDGELGDAHRHRHQIKDDWKALLAEVDVVVAPTTPMPAVPVEDLMCSWPDGTREHATEAYTRLCIPANLTGLPAISIPCGTNDHGLPVGLQVIGRAFEETTILRAAHYFEMATDHIGKIAPAGQTTGRPA